MDYVEILKKLSGQTAVSGHEKSMSGFISELFGKYCDRVEVDRFFNVIALKKGSGTGSKSIMLTAHYDEIGMLVKSIDKEGFVRVTNVGGIDSKIMLAQEVVIHGKKDIFGVIGAKPPHLLKPEEYKKAVKMDDIYVDTGLSHDQLIDIVSIGDVVTVKAEPISLQNNKVSGKAMDNRCSIAAMLVIMERLSKINHSLDIYFAATVQEEFELVGAEIAAYNIRPDMAVVIDACHGEIPDGPKEVVFPLGKGPAIGIGPILHRKLAKKAIDISKEENIPYQIDIEPGSTGTEAWATQVSRTGIPTMLVSIPVKYMHTSIETVHMDDIRNTGRLVAAFIDTAGTEMEDLLCF